MKPINFNKICELKKYKCCVYYIKNKITNKLYIGSTKRTLDKRIYEHFSTNNKKLELYIDFDIYGINNFEIGIIECNIPHDKLLEKEMFYIKKYNTKIFGYNTIDRDGFVGQLKDEYSKRFKQNNPNKMYDKNTREKLSQTLKNMDYNKGKNNPSARKVRTIKGDDVIVFDTIKQGVEHILMNNDCLKNNNVRSMIGAIVQVCKGKRKTAYGYKWEYI